MEFLEPGEGKERKKQRRPASKQPHLRVPPPHPGVIGDRGWTLVPKEEDEEDAWSVDEGIHVEDFPGEELRLDDRCVDNSEWTDLVNKTVDFVFD